jgi:hypothetical protein
MGGELSLYLAWISIGLLVDVCLNSVFVTGGCRFEALLDVASF